MAGQRLEIPLTALESREHGLFPRCSKKLASEVVGPAVIRADQTSTPGWDTAVNGECNTPMGATVAEGHWRAFIWSRQQQLLPQQLDRQAVPWLEIPGAADRMPPVTGVLASIPTM